MNDQLYFKQIEIGPMQNYVYLIGSQESRKIAVVDPAWDIDTILRIAAEDEMEVTHGLVTHTHPDHVGGGFRCLFKQLRLRSRHGQFAAVQPSRRLFDDLEAHFVVSSPFFETLLARPSGRCQSSPLHCNMPAPEAAYFGRFQPGH